MQLTPGTRLGAYEIVGLIGAGGMGEVYRAVDRRLDRHVAVKVLPAVFVSNPERVTRFQREAKTLASLNHPNIGAIYGLEEANGTIGLVLELVEGPTLADRIAQEPIELDEALPIAKQITEALEAAHEQGIVHRDLKPANIKLRPDGTVKVLDFGLAKAFASDGPRNPMGVLTNSPTITSPVGATGSGVLLGTAAYMSPEQARGKSVDRRCDMWAFGVVLYEMLAGRPLFQGATISDTLASVLRTDPDWTALPARSPIAVKRLLRRCLEKDPRRRLDSAASARLEIEDAITPTALDGTTATAETKSKGFLRYQTAVWAIGIVAVAALLSGIGILQGGTSPSPESLRLTAHMGADASLVLPRGGDRRGVGSSLALSPDGRFLAFVAHVGAGPSQLYVRNLDQLAAVALAGTADAGAPFFSPDGKWIGFFAEGKLKKVPVTGGTVVTLCSVPAARGGAWGDDGTIVYTPEPNPGASLMRVADAGGTPIAITTLGEGESTHRWAQLLPGEAVLYTASRSNTGPYDHANLVVQRLSSGARTTIIEGGSYGRYVPTGHLVFVRGGTLFAAPFDVKALRVVGDAVPVVDGISYAVDSGTAQFAVSNSGMLAYLPSNALNNQAPIVWATRRGATAVIRDSATWTSLAFAPDGERLALSIRDTNGLSDVWIFEVKRGTLTRLTVGPEDDFGAAWSPDGQYMMFTSARLGGIRNVFLQRSDGTGQAQAITDSKRAQIGNPVWHPAGRLIAFTSQQDVMLVPIRQESNETWNVGTAEVLTTGTYPSFSPDGKWIAYSSNETGRSEVYVRPFPNLSGKWQVSTNGGDRPRWSPKRRELLYVQPNNGTIMVVPFNTQRGSFDVEKPTPWSDRTIVEGALTSWDVSPDGERVLMRASVQTPAVNDHITLILNAFQSNVR